jgi:hypothetical protein
MFRHLLCPPPGALVLLVKSQVKIIKNYKMLINMYVDVAAYHEFCLLALGVCIRVIVLDGMWQALPDDDTLGVETCSSC